MLSPRDTCGSGNEYNGNLGLRISSIFVILVTATLGTVFPVIAARNKSKLIPDWAFFFSKYFGSGVIIATAFIHLLAPANEALTDPCLTGPITEYDWVEGIILITIFMQFFFELLVMRYANWNAFDHADEYSDVTATVADTTAATATATAAVTPTTTFTGNNGGTTSAFGQELGELAPSISSGSTREPYKPTAMTQFERTSAANNTDSKVDLAEEQRQHQHHQPGHGHLAHTIDHPLDPESLSLHTSTALESLSAQFTGLFILEFGVIFHSIFIGLTLAVSGDEFTTLYVVLVFHQTFEGLGLGARLASAPFPRGHRAAPYWLALAYGLTTPVAIAVGLALRKSLDTDSATLLIVNGVFDSISAGILIYTGVVELLAHEFLFSPSMRRASLSTVLSAYALMCLGAGLMALLGKWA